MVRREAAPGRTYDGAGCCLSWAELLRGGTAKSDTGAGGANIEFPPIQFVFCL